MIPDGRSGAQRKTEVVVIDNRPEVQRLMTRPGVGTLTALAYVLTIGP